MAEDSHPNLPRPPEDPERLHQLRAEAVRRLNAESAQQPYDPVHASGPITIYGQPPLPPPELRGPAPVYGSPPVPRPLWTVRGFLLLIGALLIAFLAWMFGRRPPVPAAVYGGPPPKSPPPK